MITKSDIENIKKYSFVTNVEENLNSITVFTEKGKKIIQKRVSTKKLLKILNRLKPVTVQKEIVPFGVVM